MAIFGEGGTGKSRVIEAVRSWFTVLNRQHELVVTSLTGVAAFNIRGSTLHSALGIKVEKEDIDRKMTDSKKREWFDRNYLVVDEVSMIDSKLITKLHNKLCSAKSSAEGVKFSGVNIIFCGDFLQIPSVSEYRLYSNKPGSQHGSYLWHSLNAVIKLKKQMRQAEDPQYIELLHRLRIRQPTHEGIALLNTRVGAYLPDLTSIPIIVRRHGLRHALNMKRLHLIAESDDQPITYCIAKVKSRRGMTPKQSYNLRYSMTNIFGDPILPLLPSAPLMITKNIDANIGKSPSYIHY
jgi:hypothetical protein